MLPGSYVSNFAPDISGITSSKALIAGWKKDNPKAKLGSFGPADLPRRRDRADRRSRRPATQAAARSRTARHIIKNVKKIILKTSILGGPFRFSTKSNDPLNAKFYVFQIQSNGTYKLVG